MKIVVEVDEAAERLEELVDLVIRGDDVFVCRGKPVAQFATFTGRNDLPSGEPVRTFDTRPTAHSINFDHGAKFCSIDQVWALAAEGKQGPEPDTTAARDDLYDADGLPR